MKKRKLQYTWQRSEEVKKEAWFIKRWEVFFVFAIVGLIWLINMLPHWVVVDKTGSVDIAGAYHPLHSHPLKTSKIYQNISIILIIILSLWIVFFTEMGQYLGKYGSAIFILMPSFLWLISDRYGLDIMKSIYEAESDIAHASSWAFLIVFGLFIFKVSAKFLIYEFSKSSHKLHTEWKIEFVSSLINRIFFMLLNFATIFIVSSRLMTYGAYSLGLVADGDGTNPTDGLRDKYVYFIAIIAIAASFLLVFIGIVQKFDLKAQRVIIEKSLAKVEHDDAAIDELNTKYLSLDRAIKTREIKLKDLDKRKNKETLNTLTMEISALKKEFKKAKKIKEKTRRKGGI